MSFAAVIQQVSKRRNSDPVHSRKGRKNDGERIVGQKWAQGNWYDTINGKVHLFRRQVNVGSTSSNESTTVLILAYPSSWPLDRLLQWGGVSVDKLEHARQVVDVVTAQHSALLHFKTVTDSKAFVESVNCIPFVSTKPELCLVVCLADLIYLPWKKPEPAPPGHPPATAANIGNFAANIGNEDGPAVTSMENISDSIWRTFLLDHKERAKAAGPEEVQVAELPTCPNCLERLDTTVSGIVLLRRHTASSSHLPKDEPRMRRQRSADCENWQGEIRCLICAISIANRSSDPAISPADPSSPISPAASLSLSSHTRFILDNSFSAPASTTTTTTATTATTTRTTPTTTTTTTTPTTSSPPPSNTTDSTTTTTSNTPVKLTIETVRPIDSQGETAAEAVTDTGIAGRSRQVAGRPGQRTKAKKKQRRAKSMSASPASTSLSSPVSVRTKSSSSSSQPQPVPQSQWSMPQLPTQWSTQLSVSTAEVVGGPGGPGGGGPAHASYPAQHVGCGRYYQSHAVHHFEATAHRYSIELIQLCIWDYEGDGFVHRLRYGPELEHVGKGELLVSQNESDTDEEAETNHVKLQSVASFYDDLLLSQLQLQSQYFSERMDLVRERTRAQAEEIAKSRAENEVQRLSFMRDLTEEEKKGKLLDKKIATLITQIRQLKQEGAFMSELNRNLSLDQANPTARTDQKVSGIISSPRLLKLDRLIQERGRQIANVQKKIREAMHSISGESQAGPHEPAAVTHPTDVKTVPPVPPDSQPGAAGLATNLTESAETAATNVVQSTDTTASPGRKKPKKKKKKKSTKNISCADESYALRLHSVTDRAVL
eukprot:g57633.t1